MADEPKAGWGWPMNSKKAHYFHDGWRSLCLRWAFAGHLEQGNDNSPDNCAECRKRLAKMKAPAQGGQS